MKKKCRPEDAIVQHYKIKQIIKELKIIDKNSFLEKSTQTEILEWATNYSKKIQHQVQKHILVL